MAASRADIKADFETSDIPTQGQYAAFIDGVPNIHDDYGDAPAFVRFIRLTFTAPQIRALNSAPQNLVAAPGAGFYIEPVSASVRLNFVGPVFATNPTLQFTFASADLSALQVPSILNSTISTFRNANYPTFFIADNISIVEDEALRLFISADIVSGGSNIVVNVMYRIVAV